MASSPLTIKAVCAYALQDASAYQALEDHLSVLIRQGHLALWHEPLIPLGAEREVELETQLQSASLFLVLVSPALLASKTWTPERLQQMIVRQQAGKVRVVPIILRPCDWQASLLGAFQALPLDGAPISGSSDPDEAWMQVVSGVRRVLEELPMLPASVPRAHLPNVWMIPYPRNFFFLGRDELLAQLHTRLQSGQPLVLSHPLAVGGLGGIGKTQTAVEYAYRYHGEYQAVLWARAESRESLHTSYTQIAKELHLSLQDAQEQELIVWEVKTWLQERQGWLLILDNADELNVLKGFLPPALGGHVLITTRAGATGRLAQRLEVPNFTLQEGALFLLRRAGLLAPDAPLTQAAAEEQEVARAIARELGGLPLALDQAGAYLEETGTSLAAYLHLYRQYQAALLNERRGSIEEDHPDSVVITWSLSFRRVEQRSLAAVQVLRFCAYLAPDAIPLDVLTISPDPIVSDQLVLGQALEALRAYSLVSIDPTARQLSMHRLVQAVIRQSLSEDEQAAWMQRVVMILAGIFPNPELLEKWPECELYLPHALMATTWIEQEQLSTEEAASLLGQTGRYLYRRGHYWEAEPLYKRALEIRRRSLGEEHPDTAMSLNNLALLYWYQGRYEEAEPLYKRVLEICEQQLGEEHPDTATSLNNLAMLYQEQGRYEEAEPLYKRALEIWKQRLGEEYPETATSLNNLASLYREQGRYEEAEPLYKRALEIRRKRLGEGHPDTANSLNNLATLYWEQGRYEEAEPLLKQALEIYKQQLGEEHPNVAAILNNLATLYWEQGRYEEAEPLYKRALEIRRKHLGEGHLQTAQSLNNLAMLYQKQGRYEEAEPLLKRALAIIEQSLGEEHPDIAANLNNLALLYDDQGRHKEAEPLYKRALEICRQSLGEEHPHTAQSLNNLAMLYQKQGRYEEAEPLYKRALEIWKQSLGEEHPHTAQSLNNLAMLYWYQGRYEEAEPLLKRALAIVEQSLGEEHPDTQLIRKNYRKLLREIASRKR
ncbi:FxSxx-COOH system tetratricopeptide repeat protein [Ktedonosporobacter rubrisoli]|nr:FxSxx-COOH system tetratricopeptide repeat protein [Ktedonosporobacter rubrisoli]